MPPKNDDNKLQKVDNSSRQGKYNLDVTLVVSGLIICKLSRVTHQLKWRFIQVSNI